MGDRRQRILEENGLTIAPAEAQRFFWGRYNTARRRRAVRVGDLVDRVTPRRLVEAGDELGRLRAAWREILPESFAGRTFIEGLSGGRLRVVVCSAADRYALSRQLGTQLLEALRDAVGANLMTKIDYRVGRLPREKPAEEKTD